MVGDCLLCKNIEFDVDKVLLQCSLDRPEFGDQCPMYFINIEKINSEQAMQELTNMHKNEYNLDKS